MCGLVIVVGGEIASMRLAEAGHLLEHRGPDAGGMWISPTRQCALAHRRLSIIDLSDAGRQPMSDPTGRYWIVLNGEIYNYIELREELRLNYRFRTRTDTEVLLAAYQKWGVRCLDKLIGMFAFAIWDEQERTLFAARDRFGVKPLYYAILPTGELALASEIKALHALGLPREPDPVTWATYLAYGLYDHSERTFWRGIKALPPGHTLQAAVPRPSSLVHRLSSAVHHPSSAVHRPSSPVPHPSSAVRRPSSIVPHQIKQWYTLPERIQEEWDDRPEEEVVAEYRALLEESVRLRFRSDVPVGINLSGGIDSSTLLGLVHAVQGSESDVSAFTFVTGDDRYDELPWVQQMLARTRHPSIVCRLDPHEVPDLAARVQWHEDEPFGGLPTLAYSKVFRRARELGVIVLLDGQGLDEQWAGYDYYARAVDGDSVDSGQALGPVQGSRSRPTRPECLVPDFRKLAIPFTPPAPFPDRLRNLQYRDARYTKIPRALRFNDRISMMHSTELREPFLDHRLFELAFRQPTGRKIRDGTHKWLLRRIVRDLLPQGVVEAPKRPLQTPQREWLRGPLREWVTDCIENAVAAYGGIWLDANAVRREWRAYLAGESDNSFYVWQWVNLGLMLQTMDDRR